MNWNEYDAALFDLDGVITPTADVHMHAWALMFNTYFKSRGVEPAYSDADYYAYLDGKPRYDGVRTLLTSRDITLPEGEPSDSSNAETVCGLGNRKNDVFADVLNTDGVSAYPGSIALLDALDKLGKRSAIVSSSKNARAVLTSAGVLDRFPVIVDGLVAASEGIAGKPAPDMFTYAADKLGVSTRRSVVFEDALSGIAAGHAGDFGLVIGVDRGAGADALRKAGAELVVNELDELVTP